MIVNMKKVIIICLLGLVCCLYSCNQTVDLEQDPYPAFAAKALGRTLSVVAEDLEKNGYVCIRYSDGTITYAKDSCGLGRCDYFCFSQGERSDIIYRAEAHKPYLKYSDALATYIEWSNYVYKHFKYKFKEWNGSVNRKLYHDDFTPSSSAYSNHKDFQNNLPNAETKVYESYYTSRYEMSLNLEQTDNRYIKPMDEELIEYYDVVYIAENKGNMLID